MNDWDVSKCYWTESIVTRILSLIHSSLKSHILLRNDLLTHNVGHVGYWEVI
jgi:hypothetical protein